jgi:hypothetical protein
MLIGTIFYDDTANAARYVNNILSPFSAQLVEEERLHGVFQQDSAKAHTAHMSYEALREDFGDRVISRGLWPTRSPDLRPCDFHLRGSFKCKVFSTIPHTLEGLRNNIRCEISAISGEELQKVNTNVFR